MASRYKIKTRKGTASASSEKDILTLFKRGDVFSGDFVLDQTTGQWTTVSQLPGFQKFFQKPKTPFEKPLLYIYINAPGQNFAQRGPFTVSQVQKQIKAGKVSGDVWVFVEGDKEWRQLKTVNVLSQHLPNPPVSETILAQGSAPESQSQQVDKQEPQDANSILGALNLPESDPTASGTFEVPNNGPKPPSTNTILKAAGLDPDGSEKSSPSNPTLEINTERGLSSYIAKNESQLSEDGLPKANDTTPTLSADDLPGIPEAPKMPDHNFAMPAESEGPAEPVMPGSVNQEIGDETAAATTVSAGTALPEMPQMTPSMPSIDDTPPPPAEADDSNQFNSDTTEHINDDLPDPVVPGAEVYSTAMASVETNTGFTPKATGAPQKPSAPAPAASVEADEAVSMAIMEEPAPEQTATTNVASAEEENTEPSILIDIDAMSGADNPVPEIPTVNANEMPVTTPAGASVGDTNKPPAAAVTPPTPTAKPPTPAPKATPTPTAIPTPAPTAASATSMPPTPADEIASADEPEEEREEVTMAISMLGLFSSELSKSPADESAEAGEEDQIQSGAEFNLDVLTEVAPTGQEHTDAENEIEIGIEEIAPPPVKKTG